MQGDRTCKGSAEAEKKVLLKNRRKKKEAISTNECTALASRKGREGEKRQEEAKRETKDPKDRQVRFRRRKPATAGDPQSILDWGTLVMGWTRNGDGWTDVLRLLVGMGSPCP